MLLGLSLYASPFQILTLPDLGEVDKGFSAITFDRDKISKRNFG